MARNIASDTASFASRGGAKVLGLGATLPSLTGYGKYIDSDGALAITTGHAGTAVLVGKLIRKRVEENPDLSSNPITVVGSGAMGSVLAEYVLSTGRDVVAYDEDPNSLSRLVKNLGADRVAPAMNLDSALASANIVVSAVTKSISLGNTGVDLSEKLVIDDSQPGAFAREEIEKLNGELTWVVGRAGFLSNVGGWSYADTIHSGDPMARDAVFGCEAESAVIARVAREQSVDPREFSVRGRSVTLHDILRMGRLFEEYGVDIAPSQSHGILNK